MNETDQDQTAKQSCFLCNQRNCQELCMDCLLQRDEKIYFCSPQHQKYHSQVLTNSSKGLIKTFCCPYEIKKNERIGRYLVANRVIEPGELIFTESPLVIGPHHETKPLCLTCGSSEVDGSYICPSCHLPLCNEDCYISEDSLHRRFECRIFSTGKKPKVQNFKEPNPVYQCILPLRCLLLQSSAPWVKHILDVMVDHIEDKPKDIHWKAYQKNIVEYLRLSQGLGERFSSEEINHVIGILDVNAFDLSFNGSRGLYPLTALMSHSCISNTKYIIRKKDYVAECRATVRILPGEELTDHYISPLLGTESRQACLRDGWYFDCECSRCLDPTEANTQMSSFHCNSCDIGYVTKPLRGEEWACLNCGTSSNIPYSKISEELAGKVENTLRNIPDLENLLEECLSMRLSSSHYLVLTLKRYLIYAYKSHTLILNQEIMERIKGYCQSLLDVVDMVTPGLTKERGLTLYELVRLHIIELERQSTPEMKGLESVVKSLQVVVNCLDHEDEETFQAEIRREAKIKLSQMTEILTLFKLMASTKPLLLKYRFISSILVLKLGQKRNFLKEQSVHRRWA
ncbi:SET domain-containing protein SmydA-8 isoform X2 [Lepeophtheirus salmonis]|uniref:SET domain-containing protein SmydA-8 isoform X2 n=1 Tax=Lepeophtheirus salmonis TaxID=72036 RepID=UPI001AE29A30|nr:SET domain-containing protein SmydA-8-like isoform X2 [Lepeophtheirus salmonis]